MDNKELEKYINKRYDRWLDYSEYHCTLSGIPDEAADVLNEVLVSLLSKSEEKLLNLLHAKKNGYTELDFFVLRMIKFNATSDTAPYRAKYKAIPRDKNTDYSLIDLEDINDEEIDHSAIIIEKTQRVREMLSELNLSQRAKVIFEYRFFLGENFKDWDGEESLQELYMIYNSVVDLIKGKLNKCVLF